MDRKIVYSLWVGDRLSKMENACIRSWVNLGYEFRLYVYGPVENIPQGVKIMDAGLVLPRNRLFVYQTSPEKGGGSFSGFSNFFRYKIIQEGGIWTDTDVFLLKRLPETPYLFAKEKDKVASCLLAVPPNSEFASLCFAACESVDVSRLKWGETGPALVTRTVEELSLGQYIRPEHEFFPIMYDEIDLFFEDIFVQSYTVHFWNEMWRRKGKDKDAVYDKCSLYERLVSKATHARIF